MAFFVGVFFDAAAFFAADGAVCLVLVTRPDLVLLSDVGTSTTAGAYNRISTVLSPTWNLSSIRQSVA